MKSYEKMSIEKPEYEFYSSSIKLKHYFDKRCKLIESISLRDFKSFENHIILEFFFNQT